MDSERLFKKSVCERLGLEDLGGGDYLVHTDKYFDDGDEPHIVLRTEGGMSLSDEGHTVMWLSYDNYDLTPARGRILNRIAAQNNVHFEDGRITVSVKTPDDLGSSLSSMVQAIMQVAESRHHQHELERCETVSTSQSIGLTMILCLSPMSSMREQSPIIFPILMTG